MLDIYICINWETRDMLSYIYNSSFLISIHIQKLIKLNHFYNCLKTKIIFVWLGSAKQEVDETKSICDSLAKNIKTPISNDKTLCNILHLSFFFSYV